MNAKQIDKHIANWTASDFDMTNVNWDQMSEMQRLQVKNTIICSIWNTIGPIIMFVCRSWLFRLLKPQWKIIIEAGNVGLNSACDIPQQSS